MVDECARPRNEHEAARPCEMVSRAPQPQGIANAQAPGTLRAHCSHVDEICRCPTAYGYGATHLRCDVCEFMGRVNAERVYTAASLRAEMHMIVVRLQYFKSTLLLFSYIIDSRN